MSGLRRMLRGIPSILPSLRERKPAAVGHIVAFEGDVEPFLYECGWPEETERKRLHLTDRGRVNILSD